MKMTITLSPEEVQKAIKEYLERQGFKNIQNTHLKAGRKYDMFDRPDGISFLGATVEVEN